MSHGSGPPAQTPLTVSLVSTLNGVISVNGWSTEISNETDFAYFRRLRREADAILIGTNTALNPRLPQIRVRTAEGSLTPVYVLTRTSTEADSPVLSQVPEHYTVIRNDVPGSPPLEQVIADLRAAHPRLLCESGPGLGLQLLRRVPSVQLHLSVSPVLVPRDENTESLESPARLDCRLVSTRAEDDQVFLIYERNVDGPAG